MLKPNWSSGITGAFCALLLMAEIRGNAATAQQRVRTAQQALDAGQTKLNQARQNWEKAQQEFTKAQSAEQTASNKLHQARSIAAQKHALALGLTAAVSERDAASHQVNLRRITLETELRKRQDYQEADEDANAARKRLGELSEDKSLSADAQTKLASEAAAAIRKPSEMRKEAEARDAQMRQAMERWQAAGKKIAALQLPVKKAVDTDASVIQALEQQKTALAAVEKARSAMNRAEQDFNTAQANLDRQGQQLETALEQSQRRMRRR